MIIILLAMKKEGTDTVEVVEQAALIPVGNKGTTSGVLTRPAGEQKRTAVIVAHGAGNNMNTPLLRVFSLTLAASGYPVLCFNFLYAERGRKTPDREEVLTETWEAATRFAKTELGKKVDCWVAAGKSMGGRVASQMVAENILPVDRLIFLGYPLHTPGNKEKLRDAHLYQITVPMLFFAGTRDSLCDLDKLKGVLERFTTPVGLSVVEGGDHSFHVPKSFGMTEEEIFRRISEIATDWISRVVI